jgi:hypothetical protein
MRTPFLWIPTLAAALFLSACGIGNGDDLTDIIVSPHDGAAVHGSGTDAVQFKAIGVYQAMGQYSVSYTKDLNTANWITSDGANTTVDAQGLATLHRTHADSGHRHRLPQERRRRHHQRRRVPRLRLKRSIADWDGRAIRT